MIIVTALYCWCSNSLADSLCGEADARTERYVQTIQTHAAKTAVGGQFHVVGANFDGGRKGFNIRYKVGNVERFHITVANTQPGSEVIFSSFKTRQGGAILIQTDNGGSSGMACGYVIYPFKGKFKVTKLEGVFVSKDVDRDGFDEIVSFEEQEWGPQCADRVAWQRILQFDPTRGVLVDGSQNFRAHYAALQKQYLERKSSYSGRAPLVDAKCIQSYDIIIGRAAMLAGITVPKATVAQVPQQLDDEPPASLVESDNNPHPWKSLKIGQSAGSVSYRRVGLEAIIYFDNHPVTKCVEARRDVRQADQEFMIKRSTAAISQTSATGQFLAVVCVDPDWGGRGFYIVDQTRHTFFVPNPQRLVVLLEIWISFSPDDHYAVLNQSGDEGNYTTLVVDLKSHQAATLGVPLFRDTKKSPLVWTDEQTVRYEFDSCDDPDSCKTEGHYQAEVNVVTKAFKKTRVGSALK